MSYDFVICHMIFHTYSTVHWPRNRTLCLPIFKEDKESRSHQENTCISFQTKTERALEPSQECRYPPESHSSQSPLPPHMDCTSPLSTHKRHSVEISSSVTHTSEADIIESHTQSSSSDRSLSDMAQTLKSYGLHSHHTSPSLERVSSMSSSSLSSLPLSVSLEEGTLVEDRGPGAVADGAGSTGSTGGECALETQPPPPPPPPSDVICKPATCTSTSHSENVPAVLTQRWDHVELPESLISDTLSRNTGGGPRSEVGEECEGEQHSSSDVSDSLFQLLLGPDSLMEECLPKDRDSLLALRSHMAMELVWLKQAIASRQKVSHVRICIAFCFAICIRFALTILSTKLCDCTYEYNTHIM